MEKKKNTIKLTESKLLDFIEEGVKQSLKEYRGETYNDGDFNYTRPNGENNIGTGLNYSNYGKEGKRTLTNMTMKDGDKLKTVSVNTRTVFHHGKGDICSRLLHTVKDAFYGNDKIEWTDAEKKEIEEILSKIGALAALTKKEGNKKRGYNGPEEKSDEEKINEDIKGFFQTLASEANPEPGQVTGNELGSLMGKMDKYAKEELRKMLLNGYKVFVNSGGYARNQYGMKFLYKVVDAQGNIASYITPIEKGEYKGMYGLVKAQ